MDNTKILIIEKIYNIITIIFTPPPPGKELLNTVKSFDLEEPLLNN